MANVLNNNVIKSTISEISEIYFYSNFRKNNLGIHE